MGVYSIWESSFPAGSHDEGAEITRAILADMPAFDGYMDHEIVEDLDQPGHLVVISRWRSREAADAAMIYRSTPYARRADALVSDPRRRMLGRVIDAGGAA